MGILSGLGYLLGSRPPPDKALQQAIDHAVEAVEPRLKAVSDYQRRLAPAVEHALGYCAQLASDIPGPVDIDRRAFSSDPLVHALFATPGDIGDMLGQSREVREFFTAGDNREGDEFFALLGMRQRQKTVMGQALHGEVVQNDVPQRLLYFADHTLGELGGRHETTRQRLQTAAFDSLARGFAACVAGLRQERQEASTAWQLERGLADRRHELEERQRQAIASLAPERLVEAYADWLAAPEARLYLKPTEVTVDRMGVIAPAPQAGGNFSTLNFPELVGRDRRHWIVLVARISRQDAQEALLQRQQANRYLLV
ncbi:MAG: hypothetical protein WCI19_05345 [Betaproteobacteria bacterium]